MTEVMRPALRELNRQALDTSRSVVVTACAGSGKTWLLVSRIIRLLLAGVAPSQILAITFTRKAAQEMAGRLRDWLRLLATADDATARAFLEEREVPPEGIDGQLGRARELFEEALVDEPPITITTFHSWFLQLLRNAPLEAGAFGAIALTDRASVFIDEAWEQLMTRCASARTSAATTAIETLFRDLGLENTRKLLRNFVTRRAEWWALAGSREDPVAFALDRIGLHLAAAPDADVIVALRHDCAFMADVQALTRLLARNDAGSRRRADAVLQALGASDAQAAFAAIRSAVLTEDGGPRSIRVTRALIDFAGAGAAARLQQLVAAVQARVRDAQNALVDQASYRMNAAGLTAGAALLEIFQALKRERQVADFADIEWLAFQLLAEASHAVTMQFRLDSRYRHILLDEFQDTNPLQWLALRAWLDGALEAGEPPALFIVGDPKQSIYRFRRAEPQLFAEAARFVTEQGGVMISQDESFRCASPVLAVVNRVFASQPLFAPYNEHQAHHRHLPGRVEVQPLAQRDAPTTISAPGDAAATVLRNPLVAPAAVEEDLRRLSEARAFASRLREIVATWKVAADPRAGAVRAVSFGDIMALVRRRTHLAIYERALRSASIPYITSRQGGLLDTLEAEDLSALLQFLVSPFDDLSLAHALRSPIFSLTDDALIAIARTAGKTWWDRLVDFAAAGSCPAVERAVSLLARWRERADTQPVHDQLDRIYCEGEVMRRYDAAVPAAMRAAVAANLQAYIQHALDTDSGRYPSLPRFIAELRELRAAPAEEAPDEGVLGAYGDSVRILTIHGAKGLESPIVWLLDTAAPRASDPGYDVLIDWPPEARAPAHFSLWTRLKEQSAQQRAHAAVEEQRALREDLNLLYVAMTRAQQALFVSGCEILGWKNSWYMLVRDAVADVTSGDADAVASVIAHGDDLAADARTATEASKPAARAAAIEATHTVLPTGTRKAVVQGPGLAFGTAFHRMMECLTMEPNRSAESVRRELRLPHKAFDALWSRARVLLTEPGLARFFDPLLHRRALNEVPIVTAAGELRRLDRVVEFDDEVWVIDYKTGSHASVSGTALESEYRAQIEAYCVALRHVYNGKLVRGVLLFADGSRVDV